MDAGTGQMSSLFHNFDRFEAHMTALLRDQARKTRLNACSAGPVALRETKALETDGYMRIKAKIEQI
jgi:hypothetical protein